MDAKLVVVGGDAKAAEIKLKLPTVVGRGREVSLTLPHPLVSRRHCEINGRDGNLYVRDLGSLNGTFINNERIEGEAILPSGDLLTIGTVTFRAVYDEDPAMHPPSEEEAPAAGEPLKSRATVRVPAETIAMEATEVETTPEEKPDSDTGEDLEDFDFEELDDLDDIDELGEDDLEEVENEDVEVVEDEDVEIVDDEAVEEVDEVAEAETEKAGASDDASPNIGPPAPAEQADSENSDTDEDDDDALHDFLKGLD